MSASNSAGNRFTKYTDTVGPEADEYGDGQYKVLEKILMGKVDGLRNELDFPNRSNIVDRLEEAEVDIEEEIDYEDAANEAIEEMKNQRGYLDFDSTLEAIEKSSRITVDQDFTDVYEQKIEGLANIGQNQGYEDLIESLQDTLNEGIDCLAVDGNYNAETAIRSIIEMGADELDNGIEMGEFEEIYMEVCSASLMAYGLNEELTRLGREYIDSTDMTEEEGSEGQEPDGIPDPSDPRTGTSPDPDPTANSPDTGNSQDPADSAPEPDTRTIPDPGESEGNSQDASEPEPAADGDKITIEGPLGFLERAGSWIMSEREVRGPYDR
jgi:hypothetical protein